MSSSSDFTPTGGPRTVAHGPGGARIEEVVNLWKGVPTGGVARVVNHVDWGVGGMYSVPNQIEAYTYRGIFGFFHLSNVQQDPDGLQ
jgi:hypothetical protein